MTTYRFKVTNKINGRVEGTGSYKSSKKLTDVEQIDFLHQYTNGLYYDKVDYLNIEIWEY